MTIFEMLTCPTIDGNGWSARFKRLMSTNSLILKTTVFPEWYQDRIQACKSSAPIPLPVLTSRFAT